jgi:hypothetical protein
MKRKFDSISGGPTFIPHTNKRQKISQSPTFLLHQPSLFSQTTPKEALIGLLKTSEKVGKNGVLSCLFLGFFEAEL